jgi:hypothetical protein
MKLLSNFLIIVIIIVFCFLAGCSSVGYPQDKDIFGAHVPDRILGVYVPIPKDAHCNVNGTWLDSEKSYYQNGSRECLAIFPDGMAHIVNAGIPDKNKRIPAEYNSRDDGMYYHYYDINKGKSNDSFPNFGSGFIDYSEEKGYQYYPSRKWYDSIIKKR